MDYLSTYLSRIQPLADQDTMMADVKQRFEEKWFLGTFPGWRVSIYLLKSSKLYV